MKRTRFSGKVINKMQIKLPALSANEGMARAAVSAFCAQLDPSAVELADVKCAVSEAVTNCIVHGYREQSGTIYMRFESDPGRNIRIEIRDKGCGIDDVKAAMQPLYTTDPDGERSGMGFTVMETFCDKVRVVSKKGRGTKVVLFKKLSPKEL